MAPRSSVFGLLVTVASIAACSGTDRAPSGATAGGGGAPTAGASGAGGSSRAGSGGSAAGGSGAGAGASSSGGTGGSGAQPSERAFVYVGSYENAIYVYALNLDSGVLTQQGGPVSAAPSPSFLAFAPDRRHLYAVNEANDIDGSGAGAVSAFEIDPGTGALTFLNRSSSGGPGPAHLTVDATGKYLLVANYVGGNVSVLSLEPAGGLRARVGGVEQGSGAETHQVVFDAQNRFVFVPNKGESNVAQYVFDARNGSLTPNAVAILQLPAGSGTRHLAFHPTLPFAYIINELDDSVAVAAFDRDAGRLGIVQTSSTLPLGVDGAQNTCAEIQVAPSGRFVYGSNRGHDSIAIFSVDASTGRLTSIGHRASGGETPRSFHLEQSGRILLVANQGSDAVVSFRVDEMTGSFEELARVTVPAPAFVQVVSLPAP
jgi:6-phosphogluconolactonase